MLNYNIENENSKAASLDAEKLVWAITGVIKSKNENYTVNMIPAAIRTIELISKYNNPSSLKYDEFKNNLLNDDNVVSNYVLSCVNDEVFEELKRFTSFSTDVLALSKSIAYRNIEDQSFYCSTPNSIVELSKKLLEVKDNDSVADLCAGIGNFLVSCASEYPNAKYYSYEIDNVLKNITDLRIADFNSTCISNYQKDVFALIDDQRKYNKIFANYPFKLRLKDMRMGADYFQSVINRNPNLSKVTSSDWIFNLLVLDLLENNGKAVVLMTNGSTWNLTDTAIREYFVENGFIETVIELPARLFSNTSIPTTMMVLSKNSINRNGIRLVNASNIFVPGRRTNEFSDDNINEILKLVEKNDVNSMLVSYDTLNKNDYSLSFSRYQTSNIDVVDGVKFDSVIKKITRGASLRADQLDEMTSIEPTNTNYLMLSNISNGMIDDKLPYLKEIDPKLEKYCIHSNNLILSKNGYPYKVAVAQVKNNQTVLANGNLFIIELDEEKVNPYYLKAYFDSEQGIATLKSITVGATIPNIGVDSLKKIIIPVPSLEEQKRIAEKYQIAFDEVSLLKVKLNKALDKLHHVFDNDKGE